MKRPRHHSTLVIAALLLPLLGLAPRAATAALPSGLSCTVSMSNLNFGTVDLIAGTGLTTTATLNYECSTWWIIPYKVRLCLSIGNPNGTSYHTRTLMGPVVPLNFNIYKNAAHTDIWGSIDGGPEALPYSVDVTVPAGGSTGTVTVPVHAAIYPGQNTSVPNGTYTSSYGAATVLSTSLAGGATCSLARGPSFPFTASATVRNSCLIQTSPLNFPPPAGLLETAVDSSTSLQVTCGPSSAYHIGLSDGQHASGTTRRMAGGSAEFVRYELYRDSARTQRWGHTIGTDTVAGTGSGMPQSAIIYGRVAPQPTPSAGTYADSITVTVTY